MTFREVAEGPIVPSYGRVLPKTLRRIRPVRPTIVVIDVPSQKSGGDGFTNDRACPALGSGVETFPDGYSENQTFPEGLLTDYS